MLRAMRVLRRGTELARGAVLPKELRERLEAIKAKREAEEAAVDGWVDEKRSVQELIAPKCRCACGADGRLRTVWNEERKLGRAVVSVKEGEVLEGVKPCESLTSLLLCHCSATSIAYSYRRSGLSIGQGPPSWEALGTPNFTQLPAIELPAHTPVYFTASVEAVAGWKSTLSFTVTSPQATPPLLYSGTVVTVRSNSSMTPVSPYSVVPRCTGLSS
eukprot:TRINITY_DN7103_c0_g1_i1.p1 TRINITY_DN7103_c0_g1~~TRINITY_DN7103_c0_g1_i1.p1  ORF type:complete len:217 (+),score=28.77 TRINITY_DN7103_c0_g1_i1:34-684(+)